MVNKKSLQIRRLKVNISDLDTKFFFQNCFDEVMGSFNVFRLKDNVDDIVEDLLRDLFVIFFKVLRYFRSFEFKNKDKEVGHILT